MLFIEKLSLRILIPKTCELIVLLMFWRSYIC